MLAWILGVDSHKNTKWDANKYSITAPPPPSKESVLLERERGREPPPQQSMCSSMMHTESTLRSKALRQQQPALDCFKNDEFHASEACYAPAYSCSINSAAETSPDLYDNTRHDALPGDRKVFCGKWKDPLSGIHYNMYNDAPPPPNGDFKTSGGERAMNRLQGYYASKPYNDGIVKQEVNFKAAPVPDILIDQAVSARRHEHMDYLHRDISQNRNDDMLFVSEQGKDPVGMLGTKQCMLRFPPKVPQTARNETCEVERKGNAVAPRNHAKMKTQIRKAKRRETLAQSLGGRRIDRTSHAGARGRPATQQPKKYDNDIQPVVCIRHIADQKHFTQSHAGCDPPEREMKCIQPTTIHTPTENKPRPSTSPPPRAGASSSSIHINRSSRPPPA